jgi:hypothetical protein
MLWNQLQNQPVILGWDFYIPILVFLALITLAVPVWAAILMLMISGALPLSLQRDNQGENPASIRMRTRVWGHVGRA